MKILNPTLAQDLASGNPVRLDLGCGRNVRKGFYAVDHLEMPGVDIVADLNKPLALLPDSCSDHIYSRHVLEHITEFMSLMREIHRITRPGGTIEIIVPHFSNVYGFSDPTHVRFFGLHSMFYFVAPENQPSARKVPTFYTDLRFKVRSIRIDFYRNGLFDRVFEPVFSRLVNRSIGTQTFYERRLSALFHAWQISYELEPEK